MSAATTGSSDGSSPEDESDRLGTLHRRLLVYAMVLLVPALQLADAGTVSLPRVLLGSLLVGGLAAVLQYTSLWERLRELAGGTDAGRQTIVLSIVLAGVLVFVFVAVLGGIVLGVLFDLTVPVGAILVSIVFVPLTDASAVVGGLIAAMVVDLSPWRRAQSSRP
jgi:hypothetical protein